MSIRRSGRSRAGPQEREDHNVGMTIRPWTYTNYRCAPTNYSKPMPVQGRKIKETQVTRRKGMLANLPSMPLDIMFDIFSRLKPRDILYLSWTSKCFHDVLSRSSAVWVWKTSREHEPELPCPPSDLNEAQYACLMFDHHCQICRQKVQKVQWVARVRCCNKCAGKPGHFIMARNFNQFLPQDLIQQVADALPSFPDPRPARRYNVPALYHKEEVRVFSKAILAVRGDKLKVKAMIEEGTATLKQRREDAPRYEQWLRQERVDDGRTSQHIREQRYHDVVSKLEESGWEQELQDITNNASFWPGKRYTSLEFLRKHPLVNQKKELTDRIWKNCRDELVALMEDVKDDREETARLQKTVQRERLAKTVWCEYVKTRPWSEALPSIADVCETEPFSELINKPLDVDVTAADFQEVKAQLPIVCEEWRAHARAALLDLLPTSTSSGRGRKTKRSKVTVDVAALDRATTFFKCTKCRFPASLEEAMNHRCAVLPHRPGNWPRDPSQWNTDTYRYTELNVGPWNHQEVFEFDEAVSTTAKNMVLLCGLDPEHASPRDLDALASRLICHDCASDATSEPNCMTWRGAVYHLSIHQNHQMRVLSENHAAHVRTLEETALRSFFPGTRPMQWYGWFARCKHCREHVEQWSWIAHRRHHGLTDNARDDDALEWRNMPTPWPVRFIPEQCYAPTQGQGQAGSVPDDGSGEVRSQRSRSRSRTKGSYEVFCRRLRSRAS